MYLICQEKLEIKMYSNQIFVKIVKIVFEKVVAMAMS